MCKYITVLFKKHKKHLPKRLSGTALGEFLKYGFSIFVSAWLFQSILYMNWRETLIKLFIDVILIALFIWMGIHWFISFLIAHSFNFAFNGQLFAMYTHMGATKVSAKLFLKETIASSRRISKSSSIQAAIAYGSLSRGCFKSTSDIDIRFVPKKGELNFWKACFFALKERCIAFIKGYPLDLYVFEPNVLLRKMRNDELPIMVFEENNCMKEIYKERINMNEFIEIFKKKVINKNEGI
jgi:hypothetical protein